LTEKIFYEIMYQYKWQYVTIRLHDVSATNTYIFRPVASFFFCGKKSNIARVVLFPPVRGNIYQILFPLPQMIWPPSWKNAILEENIFFCQFLTCASMKFRNFFLHQILYKKSIILLPQISLFWEKVDISSKSGVLGI